MLEAKNITVRYDARLAVQAVSLRVEPGRVISIVGPNGAGKSTLLRALNGNVKPTAGNVILDERPLRSHTRRAIAQRVAVVTQEADVRFPVTVFEFVLGGRYAWANVTAWGWESDRDIELAQNAIAETELVGFESRLMNELSGGERQRAVLARALATEAKIFLLDEPTANLDLAHQATMLRLIRSRCNASDSAAVVVTHDVNLAAEFSNEVMLMKDGRSVAFGSPREILTEQLLKQVFGLQVLVDAHPVSGAPRVTPVHEMRSSPSA
ncbi:MAG TPA: ABC transporter ATP-binding protein [Pyrinomonadaceae bacterium]|jgi:iron complex transport system ATP-binding protein|nr:ABC transporter ATP-binding protein [Pyrinomonadaceae bacterium]